MIDTWWVVKGNKEAMGGGEGERSHKGNEGISVVGGLG